MSRAAGKSLQTLMKQYGILSRYQAASGETVHATEAAVRAVIAALGEQREAGARLIEPVVVAWDGRLNEFALRVSASAARRAIRYKLKLENGDVVRGSIPAAARRQAGESASGRGRTIELLASVRAQVPEGYHTLTISTATAQADAFVISAPLRCHSSERPREWGVFAPLYAIRESEDKPIGDFADLQSLMQWVAQLDGDLVATLPLSAAFLSRPFEPSPYAPASRLFWNEIFLPEKAARSRVTKNDSLVDYAAVAAQKRALLQPAAEDFFANGGEQSARFRNFAELYPDAREYAAFRAAGEQYGTGWSQWPEHARDGNLTRDDYAARDAQYHLYAQMLAHEALTRVAATSDEGVRIYLDMPLGVHPESFDVWRNRDLFMTGVSAGAPPDPFFTKGQDWGFPPMNPVQMREQSYSYWRNVLRTQLRYAGILRLDHVMSLHRLYLVPAGFPATEGVYVRYPADELYAILALESCRHEARIVGEDLGTVPAEVRQAMRRHGIKRMFVVQFEATDDAAEPLGAVPPDAVASLNTHDMPPFSAYWQGLDAELRHELGLIDEEEVAAAHETRAATASAVSRYVGARKLLSAEAARAALLGFLAASDADIVLINLEDLWLEELPQNVPGTSDERPNWRRRMKYTLEELRADEQVRALLESVEQARRRRSVEI